MLYVRLNERLSTIANTEDKCIGIVHYIGQFESSMWCLRNKCFVFHPEQNNVQVQITIVFLQKHMTDELLKWFMKEPWFNYLRERHVYKKIH